jgi:hypothetical protein
MAEDGKHRKKFVPPFFIFIYILLWSARVIGGWQCVASDNWRLCQPGPNDTIEGQCRSVHVHGPML